MTFQYFTNNFNQKGPTLLLKIFLIIDILFIIVHVCCSLLWHYFEQELLYDFLITQDRGYPELFQYLKYLIIVLITARFVFLNKKYAYLPWLVLFLILFLDDAFMFHEKMGRFISEIFNFQDALGIRAIDFGELTYSAFVGTLFLGPLLWCYYKGSKVVKKTFIDIFILFSILLFFAIGVDMLHEMFEEYFILYNLIALIEDAGEMIVLSVLVWYFYFIASPSIGERTFLYYYLFPKKLIKN